MFKSLHVMEVVLFAPWVTVYRRTVLVWPVTHLNARPVMLTTWMSATAARQLLTCLMQEFARVVQFNARPACLPPDVWAALRVILNSKTQLQLLLALNVLSATHPAQHAWTLPTIVQAVLMDSIFSDGNALKNSDSPSAWLLLLIWLPLKPIILL